MASAKRLPSGQYRARGFYRDPVTGKVERPSFTAPTRSEAARMVAEWEMTKSEPVRMTVGECIKRYIAIKEPVLSPATIRGYTAILPRYEKIERIPVNLISDTDMQSFVSDLSRKYSPKSVRNIYGLLVSSLSMVTDKRYHVTFPQKRNITYAIPDDASVRLLIEEANPALKKAIALAAIATLRAGEVCALKYKDIDRENKTIHVHSDMVKDKNGKWIVKSVPKTSASDRLIPVPDQLIELLGDGCPEDFVYARTPGAIDRAFITLRNRLGLSCRFHDLRHYAASIMHALNIPDAYIMERGGWKSDGILKSVYRNSISEQSRKFQGVANDHFRAFYENGHAFGHTMDTRWTRNFVKRA